MTAGLSEIVSELWPLILGAVGVLMMFPITLMLYRKFLAGPIAERTKRAFLTASDDESFVRPLMETLLWRELTANAGNQALVVKEQVEAIPKNLQVITETMKKDIGQYFAQNFETMGATMQKELVKLQEIALTGRNLVKGNPSEAQEKSVESRRVNQIVATLEDAVQGPSITAKARELGDFLASVGQPELADWLDENQDAIVKVERRIRSNPALAAKLMALQGRVAGGNAPASSTGGKYL